MNSIVHKQPKTRTAMVSSRPNTNTTNNTNTFSGLVSTIILLLGIACFGFPVANAELTHRTTTTTEDQGNIRLVDSNNKCPADKKVTLNRFCSNGQMTTSLADYTDHKFFLNGILPERIPETNELVPFDLVGDCHDLDDRSSNIPRLVSKDEKLKVGLYHGSDDLREESLLHALPPDYWHSDSCASYSIMLFHTNSEWTGCWMPDDQIGLELGVAGVDPASIGLTPCGDLWQLPSDSLVWILRVEANTAGRISSPNGQHETKPVLEPGFVDETSNDRDSVGSSPTAAPALRGTYSSIHSSVPITENIIA